MARFDTADIRRYYDRHSASFVRYGQGRGSIHRAVWGPGTQTRDEAFHYVDDQIAALVRRFVSLVRHSSRRRPWVRCGSEPLLSRGATADPRNRNHTESRSGRYGASSSSLREGWQQESRASKGTTANYRSPPARRCRVRHRVVRARARSPERFFDQCRRLVRPGGLLVICDDVSKGVAVLRRDSTSRNS